MLRALSSRDDPVPGDTGDVLLDELHVVKLRRAILAKKSTPNAVANPPVRDSRPLEQKLQQYYGDVHALGNLSALCLSGGGIRSAAFALGIIQGLAERRLLTSFDYLSTVSGGGYTGSLLTAWAQRAGYESVVDQLTGTARPGAPISPLQHVRRYSSFLSPRVGILSSDTLALVALYLRNLLLNWLILIPMLCFGIGIVKLLAEGVWALPPSEGSIAFFGAIAIAAIGIAVLDSLQQRPGWGDKSSNRKRFLYFEMFPAFLGGSFASIAALKYFQMPAGSAPIVSRLDPIVGTTLIGGFIFLIAAILALAFSPPRSGEPLSTMDNIRTVPLHYAIAVIVAFAAAGALTGFGLTRLQALISDLNTTHPARVGLTLIILGPPLLVAASFAGELVYCGLTSGLTNNVRWGEAEREWLARAAGYHARAALTWALAVLVIFGGSYVVFWLYRQPSWLGLLGFATTGGVAGIITSLVGKATSTAATIKRGYESLKNKSAAFILAITTPIFIVVAISLSSALIDWMVAGDWLWFSFNGKDPNSASLIPLAYLTLSSAVVGAAASIAVNANQFSLHGIYKNRLIRTFLGASNEQRHPNPFTDFDQNDNISLHELWPNYSKDKLIPPHFLITNMALNIVATRELAWQERKALSFTASPRWVGCGDLNDIGIELPIPARGFYRVSSEYAGGMSLGTAMTISGAAASPNMGYHSSPALSLLLTFFNVRLGAWLGNPNRAGNYTYKALGPFFAAKPMIQEAFGLTDDEKPYVYLSDGGHFDNLGLYEMVRRRCHLIVVSDAGCDPKCGFEDLGNALRRASVDLNVEIKFHSLKIDARATPPVEGPYCAVAEIVYRDAGANRGLLLYLKPGYHGDEPAPVRSYAIKSLAFPHESTSDQWFRETQFEAYRELGQHILRTIDGNSGQTYGDIRAFINAVATRLAGPPANTKQAPGGAITS